MYNYKFSTKDLYTIYKTGYLKDIIFTNLIFIGVLNIPFILISLVFFVLLLKLNTTIFLITIISLILLQILVITINYNRNFNNSLEIINQSDYIESLISFTEKGVQIINNEITRNIKWNGISNIKITNKYLTIKQNTIGSSPIGLYFDGFEVSKDIIISEIEKYIKVKR